MKNKYKKPMIDVVFFYNENIITESAVGNALKTASFKPQDGSLSTAFNDSWIDSYFEQ